MTFILNQSNSIANHFLLELRDKTLQQNRPRFRKNMERLGEILAFEISKKLEYTQRSIKTPLGEAKIRTLTDQPVLITVLRAGLPFHQGFQNFFDQASSGFIGAYRKEGIDDIKINLDYLSTPSLEGKQLILIDPMLATGKSFVKSILALLHHGMPRHVHIATLVAAPEGLQFLEKNLNVSHSVWTCAVDEKLNDQFYIVPGLGDAGDLSYGEKL